MTSTHKRSSRGLRGSIPLVVALWLVVGSISAVHGSPVRCLEAQVLPADDFFQAQSTVAVRADGSEFVPDTAPLGPSTPDATGDTVNRAGNPTDDPDALCAAMVKLVEPDASAIDALTLIDTANFELVLPETPSRELAEATELVAVAVEFRGSFPAPAAAGRQFGVSFDSSAFPNYSGPALELVGRDTTFDVYVQNGVWTLGRTEYRNGQFDFTANSNQFAAIVGNGRATIVFPATVVPADIVSVGFFAVSGPGVDVVDLGSFAPETLRTVARSGAVTIPPSPSPSASPTASPRPASAPTASPSAGPGGGGVSTTNGSGTNWLLPVGIAAAALIAAALVARAVIARRQGARTTVTQAAAKVIAADVAKSVTVGRAWKDADPEPSSSRTALLALAAAALVALLVIGGVFAYANGMFGGPGGTAVATPGPTVAPSLPPTAGPTQAPPPTPAATLPIFQPPFLPPTTPVSLDPAGDGIHSLEGVDAGYFPGAVDIRESRTGIPNLDQLTVDQAFNATTFDCSNVVDDVLTVCTSGDAVDAGPMFVAAARFDEPIPHAPSDGLLTYALVLDADGDPANNFKAEPPFINDFYQGTDRWYELIYTPATGWDLTVDRGATPSDARVAIMGDLMVFFVPMPELAVDAPFYRLTAFASSDASFLPATSGGDLAPGPPDDDFELSEPIVDGEAAARFLVRLGAALSGGDTTFLFDRLHSATLDRYGEANCQRYVAAVVDPANALVPGDATGPASWDYVTDGLTTTVPAAFTVSTSGNLQGQAVSGVEFHVAVEDGTFRWFTDCGAPVG